MRIFEAFKVNIKFPSEHLLDEEDTYGRGKVVDEENSGATRYDGVDSLIKLGNINTSCESAWI